jgi:hypothetical protein
MIAVPAQVPQRVENGYEGSCFRQEDLQELQDCAPPQGGLRDLLGRSPQAAPGLRSALQSSAEVAAF